jgi:hypothetical protein
MMRLARGTIETNHIRGRQKQKSVSFQLAASDDKKGLSERTLTVFAQG